MSEKPKQEEAMSLGQAWEQQALEWTRWARQPGHDSYWRFHRDAFLALVPQPGRLTLDIGCGEGRVGRDLKALGHRVIAIDVSPTLAAFAAQSDPTMQVLAADAAHLPLEDGVADLAVAFMSFHDMDDMRGAMKEAGRVLSPGARLCFAIVHPINSAGKFTSDSPEAPFAMEGNYFEQRRYADSIERDGLRMTFHSDHRPLQDYFQALSEAGFLVEALHETTVDEGSVRPQPSRQRWQRIPLFLDVRAVKR